MHLGRAIAASAALAAATLAGQERADFTARSELVVLHAVVTDRNGGYVGGLSEQRFRVYDSGELRTLSFFRPQDAPATVGLVIDSSGSMFANRERVAAAAAAFAGASHPEDEFFPVIFSDRVRHVMPPGTPFTSEPDVLRDAVFSGLGARGRTALYDALLTALDQVGRGSRERHALIVVSDGADNASRATFGDVLARAQASNAVIHTVALVDPLVRASSRDRLRQLAAATGGEALSPRDVDSVFEAFERIAADIRSGYTLAYVPTGAQGADAWRSLRVEAFAADGSRLRVRTRTGYIAGTGRAPAEAVS